MADQFLGFDLSTQQLKGAHCPTTATPPEPRMQGTALTRGSTGIIVGSDLKLIHEAKVDFDADLAHHGIEKGVLTNPSEGEVFAPVAMFLEAVDLVLQRLKEQGADFGKVKGVSGAGMQHGTVFWGNKAEELLAGLDGGSGKSLREQLGSGLDKGSVEGSAFSHAYSPNWQDASTQSQCEKFDEKLGGGEKLADGTGSSAHHVSLPSQDCSKRR
jgi:xylulokinase